MISKTGLHAVKALALLAGLQDGDFIGTTRIADEVGAPPNYLGKLLQQLASEGLVESRKGFGGGFRLNRQPDRIPLYDVIEPIDRVSKWKGCFLGRSSCSDSSPCAVHDRWSRVRSEYLEFLRNTSVADLLVV